MVTVRGSTVRNRQIVNSRRLEGGNIGNIMEIFHGRKIFSRVVPSVC